MIIKVLKIVLPLGVGLYLTWYFFSGMTEQDMIDVKRAFADAHYGWVLLSLVVALMSHVSRAYRWKYLVDPLGYRPRFLNAYHGVMAGYVINYTVPRSGEVARAGLMNTYEKIPFEKGFGTIVVERLVDLIMLGIVVLISGYLQTNSDKINAVIDRGQGSDGRVLWLMIAVSIFLILVGTLLYRRNERVKKFIIQKTRGFWEGIKSVWIMEKKWPFIFHTVFIWVCYVAMLWVSAKAFPETENMPIGCVFAAFVASAAAIGLLPGGLGLYPLWVNKVLVIYEIQFAGFGIFVWVVQTSMLVILGLASLWLIQRQPKQISTDAT